jgi:hypothetical protein
MFIKPQNLSMDNSLTCFFAGVGGGVLTSETENVYKRLRRYTGMLQMFTKATKPPNFLITYIRGIIKFAIRKK